MAGCHRRDNRPCKAGEEAAAEVAVTIRVRAPIFLRMHFLLGITQVRGRAVFDNVLFCFLSCWQQGRIQRCRAACAVLAHLREHVERGGVEGRVSFEVIYTSNL